MKSFSRLAAMTVLFSLSTCAFADGAAAGVRLETKRFECGLCGDSQTEGATKYPFCPNIKRGPASPFDTGARGRSRDIDREYLHAGEAIC